MDPLIWLIIGVVLAIDVIIVLLALKHVPPGEIWVIARKGHAFKELQPGVNIIVPFIDKIVEKRQSSITNNTGKTNPFTKG